MSSRDWNRRVWRLAGPIMLSNVSVPLLGAVDTAVVGHLPGPQYIGAVAVGSVVFNFIYWGFGFLRMGTTGLTAQALGAEDPDEVRAMFLRAMGIAVILGALILLFQAPFAWAAFGLMGASPEVDTLAREYFAIRIWAAPAALANFALLGWFIGVHKAGAALALQVLANGVNIVLDLWFVMGLGLGVKGVAIASVIAQLSSVALGLWLVARNRAAHGRRLAAGPGAPLGAAAAHDGDQPGHLHPHAVHHRRLRPVHGAERPHRRRVSLPPTLFSCRCTPSWPTSWTASPMRRNPWWAAPSAAATAPDCARRSGSPACGRPVSRP